MVYFGRKKCRNKATVVKFHSNVIVMCFSNMIKCEIKMVIKNGTTNFSYKTKNVEESNK